MLRPLLVGMDNTITNHQKKIKMTDYRTTLKSNIQSVEVNKKNVKIDCHNAKAGKLVITTLNQNTGIFGGNSYNIADGLTAKDFKVKFDTKEDAQEFHNNLVSILNDKTVPVEAAAKSGLQNVVAGVKNTVSTVISNVAGGTTETSTAPAAPAITSLQDNDDEESSSKMPLIIGGAVVLLVVIALVIWKMKK